MHRAIWRFYFFHIHLQFRPSIAQSNVLSKEGTMNRFLLFTVGLTVLAFTSNVHSQGIGPAPAPLAGSKAKATSVTYAIADLLEAGDQFRLALNRHANTNTATGETLRHLICTVIHPATWEKNGGDGVIQLFERDMTLVVKQSPKAHEEISQLLNALRRLIDTQIAMDIQVFSVPDATWEMLEGLIEPNRVAFLDPSQRKLVVNALSKDRGTTTLFAPKLTTFNGQRATVASTENRGIVTGVKTQKRGDQVFLVPQIDNQKWDLR
jgi:uncharacterized protein YggL (DUF469 family)